jgi:hypothetical protein
MPITHPKSFTNTINDPLTMVEGASTVWALAHVLAMRLQQTKEPIVSLPRTDLIAVIHALQLAAYMVDNMTMALECGDSFSLVHPQDEPV